MNTTSNRAVFLDRDGVLNSAIVRDGKPYPPSSLEELTIPDNVPELLSLLRKVGFLLIGITNQPDVARGTQTREMVERINDTLLSQLPLLEIRVCYHDDEEGCSCRKPLPGLLIDAAKEYAIDLSSSYCIGDRWRDVEAGLRAGCRAIWINYGYREKSPDLNSVTEVFSLREAVDVILSTTR